MKYITPSDHKAMRREVHPSQRQSHIQPVSADLHVVTVLFNPQRFRSRYTLWYGWEKHVADSGAIPWTVEIALRDRHHEVTDADNPHHIQLRTDHELWFKENGDNVALRHLPANAEYIAFCDADFLFTRPDWAVETVHMLQHHEAVQMYADLTYLTHDHRPVNTMKSFAFLHCNQRLKQIPEHYGHKGAVGGAWAFRRSALDKLGGMLETCILGSGDWHMAFALAMREDYHPEMKFHQIPQYVKAIQDWRDRAGALKGNIGYVQTLAMHHWHGHLKNRGYSTRWQILTRNTFDPFLDLRHDMQGLLALNPNKPQLAQEIRQYFAARNEDHLYEE